MEWKKYLTTAKNFRNNVIAEEFFSGDPKAREYIFEKARNRPDSLYPESDAEYNAMYRINDQIEEMRFPKRERPVDDTDPMGLYNRFADDSINRITSKETDMNTPLVKPATYGVSAGEVYRKSSGVPAGGRTWNDQTNMMESRITEDPAFSTVASVLDRGKFSGQQLINAFAEDAKRDLLSKQGPGYTEKQWLNHTFNMMRNSGYGSAADNPTKVYDFTAPVKEQAPFRNNYENRVAYNERRTQR